MESDRAQERQREYELAELREEVAWYRDAETRVRSMARLLASGAVSLLIVAIWVSPLSGDSAYSGRWIEVLAAIPVLATVYAGLSVWSESKAPTRARTFVLLGGVPLLLIAAGAYLQPHHRAYDEARRAFDAYTAKFPRARLADPYVLDGVRSGVVTVCAPERPSERASFCVQTATDPGYEVDGDYDILGSFRYRPNDDTEIVVEKPFDCTGSTSHCPGR